MIETSLLTQYSIRANLESIGNHKYWILSMGSLFMNVKDVILNLYDVKMCRLSKCVDLLYNIVALFGVKLIR